jgi:hypothetical protein
MHCLPLLWHTPTANDQIHVDAANNENPRHVAHLQPVTQHWTLV